MIFHILVFSVFFYLNMGAATESIDITRDDVAYAVKSLSEQQHTAKDDMIKQLLKLPASQRAELIKNYELQIAQMDSQEGMGIDTLVFDIWYPKFEGSIFPNEKEREKFERAMANGELVGIHEEKGFAVIMIDQEEIYIIPSNMEGAMMLAQSIQESLQKIQEESQAEFEQAQKKFQEALEEAEKMVKQAQNLKDKKKGQALLDSAQKIFSEAQEKMTSMMEGMLKKVCDQYFDELEDGLLYDILFLRVFGKKSQSWMPDVIKAVKAKTRKN